MSQKECDNPVTGKNRRLHGVSCSAQRLQFLSAHTVVGAEETA